MHTAVEEENALIERGAFWHKPLGRPTRPTAPPSRERPARQLLDPDARLQLLVQAGLASVAGLSQPSDALGDDGLIESDMRRRVNLRQQLRVDRVRREGTLRKPPQGLCAQHRLFTVLHGDSQAPTGRGRGVSRTLAMREIITVSVGGSGNRLGGAFWASLLQDHGIAVAWQDRVPAGLAHAGVYF